MTRYKCGHEKEIIVMEGSPTAIAAWVRWKNSVGFAGDKSVCWDCWCKKMEVA